MASPEDDIDPAAPALDGADMRPASAEDAAVPVAIAATPSMRARARSIPPPLPLTVTERRRRPTIGKSEGLPTRPEQPTAVDRALAQLAELDDAARAAQLARELEAAASADPIAAAAIAYELGELCERRLDQADRAMAVYRRACALDPSLRPARWALRRSLYLRAAWDELASLIEAEIAGVTTDHERLELQLERAIVLGHRGDLAARDALEAATKLEPQHVGALLELERVVARIDDPSALRDAWERLAEALEPPEHKLAYWLEVARHAAEGAAAEPARSQRALDAAARLAASAPSRTRDPLRERVARERLRLADEHGTPEAAATALDGLIQLLSETAAAGRSRELVALRRRQALQLRATAPARAWQTLQHALALVPDDPAILVELIELAAELGHAEELARLIRSWQAVERRDGRAAIIAGWVGELARVAEPTRSHRRAVLQALDDNGSLLLASTAEAHALRDPSPRGLAELAAIYAALASAAADGIWLDDAAAPDAAVALYLQAAHVLAYHVATPDAVAQARARLADARALAPAHPGVREAMIELDDATGHPVDALGQLAAAAAAAPGEARAIRERALRVAWAHVNEEPACIAAVRALERAMVADAPDDAALAWRLAASLESDARTGSTDDLERLALLDRLARTEVDAKRRATAVFLAARLHAQRGNADAAIAHHRTLRALWPDDDTVRDDLRALLRRHGRWTELVQERREELDSADPPTARRVLREAAWVLEHRLDDVAQAARVYDAWRARLPDDRTALEGVARCRAALRDAEAELAARAEIRDRDATREARWLYARALERAGRDLDAIAAYHALLGDEVGDDTAVDARRAAGHDDDADIVAASAALALGELAERTGDLALRASAATALATRTRDPRLGAALLEDVGWTAAIALADFDRAAQAFDAALALAPDRPGALLGAAVVAARRTEPERQAARLVELATAVPALAAPLLLRAAAIAAAEGEPAQADARIAAARRAAPDDIHALVVACEAAPPPVVDTGDPFAAFDQQLERAEQLEKRAALSDDPAARVAWELERAWVLEQAGQLHEACAILSTVLRIDAKDWRAIAALRRIAHRAGDRATWAAASYALARRSRDLQLRLRLLRDAADVYDRPGTSSPELALTIYRRILAIDPGAPELDRLLEMLRQRGDARELVAALTTRLTWLTGERPDDARVVAELVQRLLDRANVLQRLGQHAPAARDLDAVLALAPHHAEAQRQRTASPWQPDPTVTDAGDDDDDAGETNEALRAQLSDDPFGNATALVDVSALQAQERRVARARSSAYEDVEVTSEERALVEPGDSAGDLVVTALAVPAPRITATVASPAPHVRDTDAVPIARVPALDLGALFPGAPPEGDAAFGPEPMLDADAIKLPDEEQLSPDDSAVVMLSLEQLQPARSDDATRDLLASYERELALGDAGRGLSLRLEAARLAELLDEPDRARQHFEAARASEPRATVAMRGLRRLARAGAELAELTTLLDAELAVVAAREREPLRRYRLDLLMATGAHDAARAAIAELLGATTSAHDAGALLAQLELALRGDRGPELATALEQLATALEPHPALRGALATARAVLAVHGRDASAAHWRAIAADAEPSAPAARIAAIHRAVADDARDAAAGALLDLAYHIEGADPALAAALALRAQLWAIDGAPTSAHAPASALSDAARDTASNAAQLASQAAPRDALVARIAAEAARRAGDTATASHAYARWARAAAQPVERAYAAACAAELEPARLGRLWAQVLEHDPGDDYATALLRDAYLAAGERALAIELDVPRDAAPSPAAFLRAAAVWREARAPVRKPSASDAAPRDALALLEQGRAAHPSSSAIAEALADALADAGRWADRAALRAAIADEPGPLARDVARLRAAVAAEQAARKADGDEAATVAAIDAWDLVLADDPRAAHAHAAQLSLAARLRDPSVLLDALARAEASERAPWVASSLALRRARLVAINDPRQAQDIASQRRDAGDARIGVEVGYGARSPSSVDDPRRTLAIMLAAAQRGELGDAATALDDRATALDGRGDPREPAALRLRAAQLALAADDAPRALRWLVQIAPALPGLTADLIDAAQHRAGDATLPIARVPTPEASDAFTRVLRDAELAESRDQGAAALALYQRALALRPGDPLAAAPLVRLATAVRDQLPIAALALEQIRAADAALDPVAKASAYELLARAETLRGDAASAQLALEAAIKADPSRIDLVHRLEHQLAAAQRWPELLYLRELQIDQLERSVTDPDATQPGGRDLGAMIMDATILAVRAKRSEATLADLYRAVLDTDPRHRLAVFHLASIVRRAGGSEELASLEERLADELDDPRSKAAFLTRAGETLARLARPVDALQRFARAVRVLPGHRPALAAWQRTALASELWLDAGEAVIHTAKLGGEPHQVAALHHLAGVLRMDRAHADDLAIAALRAALGLAPDHLDSFVRLRMLLTQRNARDELAALLRARLEVEPDPTSQIELHRRLADHGAETGDRDAAMLHYRAVLGIDPADVRAHAAIADLASEQGNWQNAAHAINARIPLEHEPSVLRSLHFRLGALYAEREPAKAIAAFQRALHYKPGDEATLIRLTDLAIAARDWQLAFNACDQLVTTERDPDKLAVHLHRAATIFARGMNDHERASRMLQLAFDSAPTNPEALRRLIAFFDGGDPVALRAQLERVATAMRARVAASPRDAAAYRILSRALAARPGAPLHAARAAAELAHLLGTAGEPEQRLLAMPPTPAPRPSEDRLFAGAAQPALRYVLRASSAALVKHLGADIAAHGVGRRERLPAHDPLAITAREVATQLGFKDLEVYVSTRHPHRMAAEPTSPVSLILGASIVTGDPSSLRFAAGGPLALAQLGLALPARLALDELGSACLAAVRIFQPALAAPGFDGDRATALATKLRRAMSSAALEDARPHALAIEALRPDELARDLKLATLRAGVAASGRLMPALALLATAAGSEPRGVLGDALAQGVIRFALED